MEEGFIPDMGYGNATQLVWQRGIPENKKFLGLKSRAVKLNENEYVKISARRCTKCGLLKLYARPPSE